MKRKDYMTLAVIAVISGIISLVLSKQFLTSDSNRSEQVEVVETIYSDFQRPPGEYYNKDSINPTQVIEIGPNSNSKPFEAE